MVSFLFDLFALCFLSRALSRTQHNVLATGSSQVRGQKPRGGSVEEEEAEEATAKTRDAACRRRRLPMPPKELAPLLLFCPGHWACGIEDDEAEAPERARAFIVSAGRRARRKRERRRRRMKRKNRESEGRVFWQ